MRNTFLTLIGIRSFFFLVLILAGGFLHGQNTNQQRLSKIDGLIEEAVRKENYQKAADYKREKKIRLEMKKALSEEDYIKAAELQKQLDDGVAGNQQIANLEKKLQDAIDSEDYATASQIKKDIEQLKNGGTLSSSGSNISNSGMPEPEFQNQVVYYSESSNRVVELEKETPELKTSTWAAPGYAKSTSYYLIKNPKSPVRMRNGNNLKFLVKIYQGIDPSDNFKLVKLKHRDNDRVMEYFTASGSGWGSGGANKVSEFDQEIRFERVKEGLYMITTQKPLEPGEYAFFYSGIKMYAFGIDN